MYTKILFVAAAALLATTAGAQTSTTTVKETTTAPAPVTETTKQTTTSTTQMPAGVHMHNGHWMYGTRYATNAQIAAHKQAMAKHSTTTKTTVKTETPQ